MNRLIATLISCLTIIASAHVSAQKKNIENQKTEKHINIPGTRLFIIPPPDFKVSNTFVGLKKGENSGIQVFDLIDGNYTTNAATFSEKAFEEKGFNVFDYRELKVNQYPAKYVAIQGDPNSKAISIVFGDTTFSLMIMALYPTNDDKTGDQIQTAIRSIYYDKNFKIDPFATAAFTLDESKSQFKFSKFSSGIYVYSLGGVDKESFNNEPFVTISTLPIDHTFTAKGLSEMLISSLEQYGLTDKDVQHTSSNDVNGYPACESVIAGKINGMKSQIYQLIILGEDKAIAIQGIVKTDFENTLREIKNLAKTITLK